MGISVGFPSGKAFEPGASSLVPAYPWLKRTDVVQVKYTNQVRFFGTERDSMLLVQKNGPVEPARTVASASLSFSGSNQAREGRLVDALAVRGDEGRDTLR